MEFGEAGGARERTMSRPADGDHGVAMVIVLWFVQDCESGNRTLKKRPTCSHAEMQSPCEHDGRSLQWNQYHCMDLHRRGHSKER